jgi:hypothetical protein
MQLCGGQAMARLDEHLGGLEARIPLLLLLWNLGTGHSFGVRLGRLAVSCRVSKGRLS